MDPPVNKEQNGRFDSWFRVYVSAVSHRTQLWTPAAGIHPILAAVLLVAGQCFRIANPEKAKPDLAGAGYFRSWFFQTILPGNLPAVRGDLHAIDCPAVEIHHIPGLEGGAERSDWCIDQRIPIFPGIAKPGYLQSIYS